MHIGSIKTNLEKEIWAGIYECPRCHKPTSFHLYTDKRRGYIFGINFVKKTVERYMFCDECSFCSILSKDEYRQINTRQKRMLNNMEFPDKIVMQDYNPKKLKLGRKIMLSILRLFFAFAFFFMGVSIIVDAFNVEPSVMMIGFLYLALGIFLLYYVIKSLIDIIQKKKIYNKVSQKYK